MRRREFIAGLGGALAASPPNVLAQPQPTMPVIGFVHLTSPDAREREVLAAFHRGLNGTGYIEGKNVAVEYRWAQGKNDRLAALVIELVRRQVSLLVVLETTNGALAAQAATQTIPIVFMQAADPVKIGLVGSLSQPGGNITGIVLLGVEAAGKRLELQLELVPAGTSIAYLRNPTNPVFAENETKETQIAYRRGSVAPGDMQRRSGCFLSLVASLHHPPPIQTSGSGPSREARHRVMKMHYLIQTVR